MIKESKTSGYIVGFTDLGNTDDFSTEMLEWRIAQVQELIIDMVYIRQSVVGLKVKIWDQNIFISILERVLKYTDQISQYLPTICLLNDGDRRYLTYLVFEN